MKKDNKNEHLEENFMKFIKYVYNFPIYGMIASIILIIIQLIGKKIWEVEKIFFNLVPFFSSSIIFLLIVLIFYKKIAFIQVGKKRKIILATLTFVWIILNVILYKYTYIQKININSEQLDNIAKNESSIPYYVLYGSDYCTYCKYMDDIYKQAFLNCNIKHYYYINIAYEGQNEDILERNKIKNIPILIKYSKNKELERISGTSDINGLIKFISS